MISIVFIFIAPMLILALFCLVLAYDRYLPLLARLTVITNIMQFLVKMIFLWKASISHMYVHASVYIKALFMSAYVCRRASVGFHSLSCAIIMTLMKTDSSTRLHHKDKLL